MISLLQIYNDYYNTVRIECPFAKMLTMLTQYKFKWLLSLKIRKWNRTEKKKWIKQPHLAQWNRKFTDTRGTDPGVLNTELTYFPNTRIMEIGIVWGLKPCMEPKELSVIKGRSQGEVMNVFLSKSGDSSAIPSQTVNQHRILQLGNAFSLW